MGLTFTSIVLSSHNSGYSRSNIAALSNIRIEAYSLHQCVHDSRHIYLTEIVIDRWDARKRKSRQSRDHKMIRQCLRSELLSEEFHKGKKFQERARPPVKHDHRDGIGPFREERHEMNIERSQPVVDGDRKVGKGIDTILCRTPNHGLAEELN